MAQTKEHILLNSLTLFAQKGYKEVSLQDIVNLSGMSKGGFYHHFSSKAEVFSQVIEHFFGGMTYIDYAGLGQGSLKGFYTGLLNLYHKNALAMQQRFPDEESSKNFYYLIFDAMRILPEFKKQHLEQKKQELYIWKSVVNTSRNSYEINTNMTNEQVAKLFIYLNDGVNINQVIGDSQPKNQLKDLWDNLFFALRG